MGQQDETRDWTDLHSRETAIGIARSSFEAGKAKLYLSDGQPKYAAPEHERRMGELHAVVDTAVGAAAEVVDRVSTQTQTVLDHLEAGDPLDLLSLEEQTSANTRRAFIQEDVARLSPGELTGRLRLALASPDRAAAYLWARYAGQRVQAADGAARRNEKPEMALAQRQALGTLVVDLQGKVRGEQGKADAEGARKRLEKARSLRKSANSLYDDAHEHKAKVEAALRASGRYSL
jgi:hypothetical protein